MPEAKSFSTHKEICDDLKRELQGEVLFDDTSRALYATDASNYRQIPIGVVIPRTRDDVIKAVKLCHKHNVPILARGGATSLAGQCCNVAVVLDMSKYLNRILEINAEKKFARVEPGVILDALRSKAETFHLTFGPDPSTHSRCTLGGMIGNDSCGVHSIMAGKTMENVIELEIMTYDGEVMTVGGGVDEFQKIAKEDTRQGEIYRQLRDLIQTYEEKIHHQFPDIPRRVSGYALDQLLPGQHCHVARSLVGTEGTCVVILEAKLRLVPSPTCRRLVVMGYGDIFQAADHVMEVMNFKPIGLEAMDRVLIENMKLKSVCVDQIEKLPDGEGWLFVEFGADQEDEVDRLTHKFVKHFEGPKIYPSLRVFDHKEDQQQIWSIREQGPGATTFIPNQPNGYPGWEDSAVHPSKLGSYLRDLYQLYERYQYQGVLYGHFGDGCVHTRINFDLKQPPGIEKYKKFIWEASELVVKHGGSLSGEHGDGQSRGELLSVMYGNELVEAFQKFKTIWDPDNKMNPGKVVNAYPMDQDLRPPLALNIKAPQTNFRFPEDGDNFVESLNRCVGLGKCRKQEGGTMCPSFRVTQDEKHSTRGRAHLLYEMLQGDVLKKKWQNDGVKEALDLCLSCKACKVECPTNVDMATYKAEFMSHYFNHWLRPLNAYFFGHIHRWAKWGSFLPNFVNFATRDTAFGAVFKSMFGVAPQRKLPLLAPQTFKHWFFTRKSTERKSRPEVILWTDTFNNYFKPQTLKAAVYVLEKSGFRVLIPRDDLCCGRAYYEHGMLRQAKSSIKRVLRKLLNPIRRGVPIVGLEPSCLSVFKDEMLNLFPHDMLALRFSKQIFLLSDFLEHKVRGMDYGGLQGKALVQRHCHHDPIFGATDENALLAKLGLEIEILDSGCCGMAGAFGYHHDRYDVSQKIGELGLFPKVRDSNPETYIIANGFSCREQVEQQTGRKTYHLSEVLCESLCPDLEKDE